MRKIYLMSQFVFMFSILVTMATGKAVTMETPASLATCPADCTCNIMKSLQLPQNIREIYLVLDCPIRSLTTPNDTALFEGDIEGFLSGYIDLEASEVKAHKPMTQLAIRHSILSRVLPIICEFPSLQKLDLSNNRIHGASLKGNCLSNMASLETLVLDNNPLHVIQSFSLQLGPNLQVLSLALCNITEIETDGIISPENNSLRTVNLRENRLSALDSHLLRLQNQNQNRTLEEDRDRHLKIDLSENPISLSTNVKSLTGSMIKESIGFPVTVDLSGSRISNLVSFYTGLGFSAFDLDTLFPMNLSFIITNNPLVCDCSLSNAQPYFDKFISATCQNFNHIQLHNVKPRDLVCNLTRSCPNGCSCVQVPSNRSVEVICSNLTFTQATMPPSLPTDLIPVLSPSGWLMNFTFALRLRSCSITEMNWRRYLQDTSFLDLYDNDISVVEQRALIEMTRPGKTLYLHKNKLQTLPLCDINLNNLTPTKLWLTDNPWQCNCKFGKLLLSWIDILVAEPSSNLVNKGLIKCGSGYYENNAIIDIPPEELCQWIRAGTLHNIFIGIGCFLSALFICAITYKLMYKYRVAIYTKFKFQPFDLDECHGEDMKYDAFLSYPDVDSSIVHVIGETLESQGYKVCMHKRDFRFGESIFSSMERAIKESKRTICFLSDDFLSSEFCLFEFQSAMVSDVTNKRHRLHVIVMRPFHCDPNDPAVSEVRTHIKRYTYLEYTSRDFFDQLYYILPKQKLGTKLLTEEWTLSGDQESEVSETAPLII